MTLQSGKPEPTLAILPHGFLVLRTMTGALYMDPEEAQVAARLLAAHFAGSSA